MRHHYSIVFFATFLVLQFSLSEAARAQLGEYWSTTTEKNNNSGEEQGVGQVKEQEGPSEEGRIYILCQAGFLFGNIYKAENTHSVLASSMQLSTGYRLRHWLQTGMGAGYAQYDRIAVFPIFAEVRGNLTDKDLSPYYAVKAGGSFAGFNDNFTFQTARGGFMAEGQFGFAISLRKLSFLMGGGYHFQKVELQGTSQDWRGQEHGYHQKRNIRRMIFISALKFTL